MGSVSSYPLFWPAGRKLFRQRPRGRALVAVGCVAACVVVVAGALVKLGWI